jgi:hypothetical protein
VGQLLFPYTQFEPYQNPNEYDAIIVKYIAPNPTPINNEYLNAFDAIF